ncbi:hypothetical protein RP20_CCG013987 [Aedes albopictus]|nr:hypothetical protein RP20_CCG013987 [Aedes albopictus]
MPFKIVQTVENGELCLCVVPAQWEQNGVLSWPKKMAVARLCRDENSYPSSNWEKINCVLKRELPSYASASQEMERMESVPDTEVDDEAAVPSKAKKQRRKNETRVSGVVKDFNEFLSHPETDNNDISAGDEEPDEANMADKIDCLVQEMPDKSTITSDGGEQNPTMEERLPEVEEFEVDDVIAEASLNAIVANQVVLYNNQLKIMASLAHLTTAIEALNKKVFLLSMDTVAQQVSDEQFKPIGTIEDLDRLEQELKDEAIMKRCIDKLSAICGTEGKSNGGDCAFRLIDYFATREFMNSCSWTGAARDIPDDKPSTSKESDGPPTKIPLKFYVKVRELFLRVIRLADRDYSEASCEKFLKGVLKNSKARLTPKVLSTQKRRPANLKYKKKPDGVEQKPE